MMLLVYPEMYPENFEVFLFSWNVSMTYEWASCAVELKLSRTSEFNRSAKS